MTTLGPEYSVEPEPLLSPPTVCLLSSCHLPLDPPPDPAHPEAVRWGNGIKFMPEGANTASVGVQDACSDSMTAVQTPGPQVWKAYGIWAAFKCNTWGFESIDYEARAERKLLAVESKLIESEAWTNSLTLQPAAIRNAAATDVGTGTALRAARALGEIENALTKATSGFRCMIHTSPAVLCLLETSFAIRREGNNWLTPSDNLVIAGPGYGYDSPDGMTAASAHYEWMYSTPVISVRRGPIQVLPPGARNFMQAMHRETNDVTFYAERLAMHSWDDGVPAFFCKVDKSV